MGKFKIIAGEYRSRVLHFSDFTPIKPTLNKVRESLFNWLGQYLHDKICLDLFAGSGSLGFEALSRFATQVVIIESHKKIFIDIVSNANKLLNNTDIEAYHNQQCFKINKKLTIINSNSQKFLLNYINLAKEHQVNNFDIIFLDPPYDTNLLNDTLNFINEHNSYFQSTIIYIEYETMPISLSNFIIIKQAIVGIVKFALLSIKQV